MLQHVSRTWLLLIAALSTPVIASTDLLHAQTASHTLTYAPGKSITLNLPSEFDIDIAATGMKRVRFFAQSPDGRVFATSMHNLADNTQGAIYILGGWDKQAHKFTRVTQYLSNLRNPNNLAFWTDPATEQTWLYLPLTDKLLRYKYSPGDLHPASEPEVLMHFPDYGLNYKYGGWHLTRTVVLATLHGHTRLYVSAGSSCNYCQEREIVRAAMVSMEPDGSDQRLVAQGLRNAVDVKYVAGLDGGALFATNMGDDHLGPKLPEDTFLELDSNKKPGPIATRVPNYGWPTCYFAGGKPLHDTTPLPQSSPLGDRQAVAPRPAGTKSASRRTAQSTGYATESSVYGKQTGVAAAGTNTVSGGNASIPDPNAELGKPPDPLNNCKQVPAAYTTFVPHAAPLGLEYFDTNNPQLRGSFLVALHGSGDPRIGTGYTVVRFSPNDRAPHDFITGFLTVDDGKPKVHGRPCGLLRLGPDTFLLTDDYLGLVYYIHPKS